ncbi:zinc ribbon domain-containing protein [bacterium]|nr:zinc ribbon domain-containing protein [bacterium]
MIFCVQCGHQNDDSERSCVECGALLPRANYGMDLSDSSSSSSLELETGRVRQFADAVEKVRSGEWSVDDFGAFINHMYELLSNMRAGIEQDLIDMGYEEFGAEEMECGLEGLELFDVGMVEMSHYCEDEDEGHLAEGMESIVKGNEKIHEAKCKNRSERKGFEADWAVF